MGLASALRKASSKVISSVGSDITFRRVTTGSYNTSTGAVTETTSDTSTKGFIEDISDKQVNDLIQANDRLCTVAASSLTNTPTTEDRVVISGVSYQIIEIKTTEQDNTAISYELVLRA